MSPAATFSFIFWILTVSVAFLGLYPNISLVNGFNIVNLLNELDELCISAALISKRGCALEAFVSMICWSVTSLFVRRLWNPETTTIAFKKFSADSFFGGIASAAAIFLKYHLQMRLATK